VHRVLIRYCKKGHFDDLRLDIVSQLSYSCDWRESGMKPSVGTKRKLADTHSTVPKISVTDEESTLFALLLDVVKHSQSNTTVRVAGGWVRDKVGLLVCT
jgi:hypothetical protein